jgi:hypothetical protein
MRVYLPGQGLVADDRIIEGNYDKYVPSVLIRLEAESIFEEPEPVSSPTSEPPPLVASDPSGLEPQAGPRGPSESESGAKEDSSSNDSEGQIDRSSMGIREQAAAVLSKASKKQRRQP